MTEDLRRMNTKKRIISLILVLFVAITCMPNQILANEIIPNETVPTEENAVSSNEAIPSESIASESIASEDIASETPEINSETAIPTSVFDNATTVTFFRNSASVSNVMVIDGETICYKITPGFDGWLAISSKGCTQSYNRDLYSDTYSRLKNYNGGSGLSENQHEFVDYYKVEPNQTYYYVLYSISDTVELPVAFSLDFGTTAIAYLGDYTSNYVPVWGVVADYYNCKGDIVDGAVSPRVSFEVNDYPTYEAGIVNSDLFKLEWYSCGQDGTEQKLDLDNVTKPVFQNAHVGDRYIVRFYVREKNTDAFTLRSEKEIVAKDPNAISYQLWSMEKVYVENKTCVIEPHFFAYVDREYTDMNEEIKALNPSFKWYRYDENNNRVLLPETGMQLNVNINSYRDFHWNNSQVNLYEVECTAAGQTYKTQFELLPKELKYAHIYLDESFPYKLQLVPGEQYELKFCLFYREGDYGIESELSEDVLNNLRFAWYCGTKCIGTDSKCVITPTDDADFYPNTMYRVEVYLKELPLRNANIMVKKLNCTHPDEEIEHYGAVSQCTPEYYYVTGRKEYYECEKCNRIAYTLEDLRNNNFIYERDVRVPLEHISKDELTVEGAETATCTKDGHTGSLKCSRCNYFYYYHDQIIPAHHTEVVDKAVEPTYIAEGKTAGSHCSVCNKVLKQAQTVARKEQSDLANAVVTIGAAKSYTGKVQTPTVVVKLKDTVVSKDMYDLTYANNIKPGLAEVTIKAKSGNIPYKGSIQKTFKIAPKAPTKIKLKKSKNQVKLTINKSKGASGYVIYRSTKKKSGFKKIATVNKPQYTNKKLKKKTYYYKVKSFVKAGKEKIYSPYSKVYKVKM